jgi:DNA-binding transcriptional LysR family regulator
MRPQDLPDLAILAVVARHGSFVRAAAELRVSRSAVSHSVRGLEERLGVRLLNRTTRSVSPTEAGNILLARLAPALGEIANAVDAANDHRERPSGRLRLNVPRLAAKLILGPSLPGFLEAHPGATIEISVDDATVDIVAGGFDAGIRFGERLSADMIAVPLGAAVEFAVVGSPSYFSQNAMPMKPEELRSHACIGHRMRGSGRLFDWEFEREGREVTVAVKGPLVLDAPEIMLDAALAGVGVCYTSLAEAQHHIDRGRLVRALADWCPPTARLYLYYPGRRHVPVLLRAFIAWLKAV